MSDRMLTVGGAVVAVLVSVVLFGGARPPEPQSRPLSHDAGPAGFLALSQWLEQAEIRVERLQQRYTELQHMPLPPTGNVLLVVEPMALPVREREALALRLWLERGNQLLLLNAYDKREQPHGKKSPALWEALHLGRYFPEEKGAAAEGDPDDLSCPPAIDDSGKQRRLHPYPEFDGHPLLDQVYVLEVESRHGAPAPYGRLNYQGQDRRSYLPLFCDSHTGERVATAFRVGAGRIWAFDVHELFDNRHLGKADNARLIANLLKLGLHNDGAVVFDDMHQGDSRLYDPQAFFSDSRLHGTLLFALAAWLIWLLGSAPRFRAPQAAASPPGGRDFARHVAGFYAHHLQQNEAASALFKHFFNRARQRLKLPVNGEPAWEALTQAPRVDPAQLRALERLWRRHLNGRSVALQDLRNRCLHLERCLS